MPTVTVVGAGPVGLRLAQRLSEDGWETIVLEEHPEVGTPEHCSGLLSVSGIRDSGLPVENCTQNAIVGAKLIAPNGLTLTIRRKQPVALVVDRTGLDKAMEQEAKKAKAIVQHNTKLIDVRKETVFVQHNQRGEMIKTKLVAGCDGVRSRVRELWKVQSPKEKFVHSYQAHVRGNFADPGLVELHFGNFAPGFFGWVIPQGKEYAKVGVGCATGNNPKASYDRFVQEKNIPISETLRENSFLIPCAEPLNELVRDNQLLCGDAAFQTKATTGGGIILGVQSAEVAANAITDHLKEKKPLNQYAKNMASINRELLSHWKMRKYFNSLNEQQINQLFEKLKKADMEEFLAEHWDMDKPTRFIGKMIATPSLWGFAGLAMKFR